MIAYILFLAGVEDWGNFGVMPVRKVPYADLIIDNWYHSRLDKASEVASPGYYTIKLTDWNATAELVAAGTHAGMHRYSCDGDAPCTILVDVCHSVESGIHNTCKNGSVSIVASQQGPPGTVIITGWVLMSGSLSGACHCNVCSRHARCADVLASHG